MTRVEATRRRGDQTGERGAVTRRAAARIAGRVRTTGGHLRVPGAIHPGGAYPREPARRRAGRSRGPQPLPSGGRTVTEPSITLQRTSIIGVVDLGTPESWDDFAPSTAVPVSTTFTPSGT